MPYWNLKEYGEALNSSADIVVFMLGTNDARQGNWKGEEPFKKDYLEMVRSFINMPSKPDVHIMIPPPLYQEGAITANQTIVN